MPRCGGCGRADVGGTLGRSWKESCIWEESGDGRRNRPEQRCQMYILVVMPQVHGVYSDASDLLQPSHFLGIGAVKALTNGFDILTPCASVVSMERGRDSQYAKRLAVDEDIHDVDKSM